MSVPISGPEPSAAGLCLATSASLGGATGCPEDSANEVEDAKACETGPLFHSNAASTTNTKPPIIAEFRPKERIAASQGSGGCNELSTGKRCGEMVANSGICEVPNEEETTNW